MARAVTLVSLPLCLLATIGLFVTLVHSQLVYPGMPAMLPSKHTSAAGYAVINHYLYHRALWAFAQNVSLFVAVVAGLMGMSGLYLWIRWSRPVISPEPKDTGADGLTRILSFAALSLLLFAFAAAAAFFLSLPYSFTAFITPPSPANPAADPHYGKLGYFVVNPPSIFSRATVHQMALPLAVFGLILQLFCCLAWMGKRLRSQSGAHGAVTLDAPG